MVDIVIEIDRKDIQQKDKSQQNKDTTRKNVANTRDSNIWKEIVEHDQDGKEQGINQRACKVL